MNKRDACITSVMEYYRREGRHDLPWRQPTAKGIFNPYAILVSEVMLQQTQVSRVTPKYQEFLALFPDIASLAQAPLDHILGAWLGLGYHRRARYLWLAAQALQDVPEPWTEDLLVACKGIGLNTARAVLVYAYDLPLTYIETNIRSVIIHHFYQSQSKVSDKEIFEILNQLNENISQNYSFREWYWALMDYGSYLKRTVGNTASKSTAYSRQSRFEGSRRQLRGRVLRLLHEQPRAYDMLARELSDERLQDIVDTLQDEELVHIHDNKLMLYNGFDDSIKNNR